MRARARAAALALLVAPILSSAAETIGVLAVADPPGPAPELAETTAQLRAVLARRTEGVLSASALGDRMTGRWSAAAVKEVDLAYARALRTYQAGDFEGSVQALRALVSALEKLPEGSQVFARWARAMLRLARVEQALGSRADARGTLDRLLRADPDVKVDPVQYPPGFVRLVDKVRARIASLPRHKLSVAGEPGLRIFVDGREIGASPLDLDLPAGSYRVAAARGETRAPPVAVDLERGPRSVAVDLSAAGALRPDAEPGLALLPGDRPKGVVAVSALLRLDRAIVVSLEERVGETYLVATSYDARQATVHREARVRRSGTGVPADDLGALATFLLTGEPSSLVTVTVPAPLAVPGPPVDDSISVGASPSLPRRRSGAMGWTAVGTGVATVALAGVSIWQAVKSEHAYSEGRSMLAAGGGVAPGHTVAEFNARADEVNRARSMAIGTGIGAGAALVATGVLGYLSYRRTGVVGPFRF